MLTLFNNSPFALIKRAPMRAFLIACVIFLTGCENLKNSQAIVDWNTHQQQLEQLTHFSAQGKLGYRDPNNNQSINFSLTQQGEQTNLRLFTFLGQTVMSLSITPTLTQAQMSGQTFTSSDPNALIKRYLGLNVPIKQLADWIKGLPSQADHIEFHESNTVKRLEKLIEQNTWTLDYLAYTQVQANTDLHANTQTFVLPKQMKLQQGETTMQIEISEWMIGHHE